MVSEPGFFIAVVASVFALVDPVGMLPFFVGLTQGFSEEDREVILRRAVSVCGGVLTLFAVAGRFLFAAFGFTLQAFEIAGGIILFIIAYDMIAGSLTRTKVAEGDQEEARSRRDEIAVVPLGIPLLAGPGAISTVMIYEGEAGNDLLSIAATFVAVLIATVATYVILRYGQRIIRSLGKIGVVAIARVMGLLLAAVAVQFILTGLIALAPQF